MALAYGSPEYLALVEQYGLDPGDKPLTEAEAQAQARYLARTSTSQTTSGGGFWSFDWIGPAIKGGLASYGKILELQNQQEMMKTQQQIAQAKLQGAMFGTVGPSAGGVNTYILLGLGAVMVFAMFYLEKGRK